MGRHEAWDLSLPSPAQATELTNTTVSRDKYLQPSCLGRVARVEQTVLRYESEYRIVSAIHHALHGVWLRGWCVWSDEVTVPRPPEARKANVRPWDTIPIHINKRQPTPYPSLTHRVVARSSWRGCLTTYLLSTATTSASLHHLFTWDHKGSGGGFYGNGNGRIPCTNMKFTHYAKQGHSLCGHAINS